MTKADIILDIIDGRTSLGNEFGSTRIKAVLVYHQLLLEVMSGKIS